MVYKITAHSGVSKNAFIDKSRKKKQEINTRTM